MGRLLHACGQHTACRASKWAGTAIVRRAATCRVFNTYMHSIVSAPVRATWCGLCVPPVCRCAPPPHPKLSVEALPLRREGAIGLDHDDGRDHLQHHKRHGRALENNTGHASGAPSDTKHTQPSGTGPPGTYCLDVYGTRLRLCRGPGATQVHTSTARCPPANHPPTNQPPTHQQ